MSRTAFVAAVVTVLIARPTAIRGVAAAFSPVTVPPNSSMNLCHSRCRSHGPRRGHSSDSLHPFYSRNGYLFRWLRLSFSPSAQALLSSRGGGGGNMGDDGRRDEGGESCGSEPRGFEDPAFRKGNDPLVLEGVKNIRDLGSIAGSGIQRGRVFRTGHLSDATESDAAALRDVTGLRTMVGRVVPLFNSLFNSLINSLSNSLSNSLINSLNNGLSNSLSNSLDSLVNSLANSLINSLIHSLIHSLINSLFNCEKKCCYYTPRERPLSSTPGILIICNFAPDL